MMRRKRIMNKKEEEDRKKVRIGNKRRGRREN